MTSETPTPDSSEQPSGPPLEEILYWQLVHGLDADELMTQVTIFQHFQTHVFFYPRATAEKLWNTWMNRYDPEAQTPLHLNFVMWHGNLTIDTGSITAFQIMDAYPYPDKEDNEGQEESADSPY